MLYRKFASSSPAIHAATAGQAAAWDDESEGMALCSLLRDIAGDPFRPATLNPVLVTADIVSLACAAYDERQLPSGELDLHRLDVLADAVEEA